MIGTSPSCFLYHDTSSLIIKFYSVEKAVAASWEERRAPYLRPLVILLPNIEGIGNFARLNPGIVGDELFVMCSKGFLDNQSNVLACISLPSHLADNAFQDGHDIETMLMADLMGIGDIVSGLSFIESQDVGIVWTVTMKLFFVCSKIGEVLFWMALATTVMAA